MSLLLAQHGEVATGYACTKPKTTCILNRAVASQFREELVSLMQQAPYSISVVGPNDTGLKRMNPLTVRVHDEKSQKVDTRFLDMCTTSGTDAATAKAIFDKMSGVLSNYKIPLDNCIGLGVDNASVNTSRQN